MLLPQFSLRTTLKLLTASAVLFLVVRYAFLGSPWAVGVVFAVLSVVFCLATYAAMYGVTIVMSRVVGTQQLPARTNRGGVQMSPDEHLRPDGNATESSNLPAEAQ